MISAQKIGIFIIILCSFSFAIHALFGEEANSPPSYNIRTEHAKNVVDLSVGPQLFIDNYLIAEWENIEKTTHAPRRVLEKPILGWQEGTTQPFVTVVRDIQTGKFRLWYDKFRGEEASIAYAESVDGINWDTPSLGILGDDNRLFKISTSFQSGYGISLIDEGPHYADKSRRFKIAWWGQDKPWLQKSPDGGGDPGMRIAFSDDGIHWTPYEGNPVLPDYGEPWFVGDPRRPRGVGDIIDIYWDPLRSRYGVFLKTPAIEADGFVAGQKAGHYIRRLVSHSVSKDFLNWEKPCRVIVPEPRDEGQLEFYGVGGVICRGPLLIGFVRMLHDDYPAEPQGPIEGIGYANLVTSRDGKHWERHDDIFFDRSPQPHDWDRAMSWIGSVILVEDEFYIYYGGYRSGHKIKPTRQRQLGLVKIKRDRFVSRDARENQKGRLLTVPVKISAHNKKLILNADATGGKIRVRLLDSVTNQVLPGYDYDDCEPISEDGLMLPVCWQGKKIIEPGVYRIEFEISQAGIFGFDLASPDIAAESFVALKKQKNSKLPEFVGQTSPADDIETRTARIYVGKDTSGKVAPEYREPYLCEGPQVLIDDYLIEYAVNVKRKVNQPKRDKSISNPLITGEEDGCYQPYFSVLQDPETKMFRIWYNHPLDDYRPSRSHIGYMESKDGIHWIRPARILKDPAPIEYGSEVIDEGPDYYNPRHRYKYGWYYEDGLWIAVSGDGINFQPMAPHAVLEHDHDINNLSWDPLLKCYVATISTYTTGKGWSGQRRLTMQSFSNDLLHWAKPWFVLRPDKNLDEGETQFYAMSAFLIRGPLKIGMVKILRDDLLADKPPLIPQEAYGIGYTTLAWTRDGRNWIRDREIFFDRNTQPQTWDRSHAWIDEQLIVQDDVYLYYGGYRQGHKSNRFKERQIGLVKMPLDRYVAWSAKGSVPGKILTVPLQFKKAPSKLIINAEVHLGSLKAQIRDAGSNALIPGLQFSDCKAVRKNGLRVEMQWGSREDTLKKLGQLANRPIKLEFELMNANLFAFEFVINQ